jgi:hypothetical protein
VNVTTKFDAHFRERRNNLLNNRHESECDFQRIYEAAFLPMSLTMPLRDDVAARATIFVIKIDSSLAITRVIFRNDCPPLCSNAVHRHKVGID